MIAISERYRARKTTFLELWRFERWRLKVYTISHSGMAPRADLISAAKRAALDVLVNAPYGHYGVGFIGIHAGRTGNFVYVDWWADENELHHRVFVSTHERPMDLQDGTETGVTGSVWDLALQHFERTAWIETVLSRETPDLDAYLARRMTVLATLRRPLTAVESRRPALRLDQTSGTEGRT